MRAYGYDVGDDQLCVTCAEDRCSGQFQSYREATGSRARHLEDLSSAVLEEEFGVIPIHEVSLPFQCVDCDEIVAEDDGDESDPDDDHIDEDPSLDDDLFGDDL